MKKIAFAVAALLATAAYAQEAPAGKLSAVRGSVTVSSAGQVVKAVAGTQLAATSTILVGEGSSATVVLNEGCVIPLTANQYLKLDPALACAQQYAAVTRLITPYRLAQASVAGGVGGAAGGGAAISGVVVAASIATIGIVGITQTDSVPPSGN
jgi:hypothetical protein